MAKLKMQLDFVTTEPGRIEPANTFTGVVLEKFNLPRVFTPEEFEVFKTTEVDIESVIVKLDE